MIGVVDEDYLLTNEGFYRETWAGFLVFKDKEKAKKTVFPDSLFRLETTTGDRLRSYRHAARGQKTGWVYE